MERLDSYDLLPSGMESYLGAYGHHISKRMYLWAVSKMRDRNGAKANPMTKEEVAQVLERHGVRVKNDVSYDVPYVYMMAKMDYWGSSIVEESKLALYVRDYLDDIDGSPTRAFDELYIGLISKGIGVDWEDVL